ncbi:MAG: methyltransferase domain-containing protein [Flavobacteriales bacterium]|nr:methyltransferase domain-containing protein [Flavobacteriales bacterium]MCB9335942.1 methyltransferase domain-containing protein [Flavobacteriales bacterium]
MSDFNKKNHWENIYNTKQLNEVSWYQPTPETSLQFIQKLKLSKDASIIDVGGGDSFLVDNLITLGYTNITVLDISENAIERAKKRLGENASKIAWVISDICDFEPSKKYALWHDRAAFHFLNQKQEIEKYAQTLQNSLAENGQLIIGTFSKSGPLKCSGIEITQYNPENLASVFKELNLIECQQIEHQTPFDTTQNFTFCRFSK